MFVMNFNEMLLKKTSTNQQVLPQITAVATRRRRGRRRKTRRSRRRKRKKRAGENGEGRKGSSAGRIDLRVLSR